MATERMHKGKNAEEYVAQYLMSTGYVIKGRNFFHRGGEIDLIAQKDELVVFVEVKMRTAHSGLLAELITLSKQRKISITALYYLSKQSSQAKLSYQFDVALVEMENSGVMKIEYIPNAFYST